jgi:hypothetical protein
VEPLDACILLWLVMWVCGINFFIQYLIWGMPFLLIAGYLRQVAALQAAMVVPMVLLYERPWHHQEWTGAVYFVLMAGLWLTLAIALARLTWAIIRSPGAPTRRAQDPAAGAQQLRLS